MNAQDAGFTAVEPDRLSLSPFREIGKDWMLITVSDGTVANPMTASWGGVGILWHKPVCTCYIRHSRFTYELIEKADTFSLTFFPPEHKEWLTYCGSHSGRDGNKAEALGMTPVHTEHGVIWKECARGIVCRNMFAQDLDPDLIPDDVKADCYPGGDFHRMYIGEVMEAWEIS